MTVCRTHGCRAGQRSGEGRGGGGAVSRVAAWLLTEGGVRSMNFDCVPICGATLIAVSSEATAVLRPRYPDRIHDKSAGLSASFPAFPRHLPFNTTALHRQNLFNGRLPWGHCSTTIVVSQLLHVSRMQQLLPRCRRSFYYKWCHEGNARVRVMYTTLPFWPANHCIYIRWMLFFLPHINLLHGPYCA